jgi:murein DD-endopeptidase MepM/ murein hydrolase activator NlpD
MLIYKIDTEDELVINYKNNLDENASSTEETAGIFTAEVRPINYEIKIVTKEGLIETSMYEAALKNNIDERAIIELANAFQWTIDFALDPRVGDKFKFIYEERYLNGEYKMPGKILAGQYINGGKNYEVYYFEENKDNIGYFDEKGNSVQKMFLKAPVAFKYISSGFTIGLRYVEAFNVSTGHRAVDYAATYGTPIRAVGDGTVIFAAYNGAYGNMVKIRHNGTYVTNYGHMSKFAVKYGNKVKQGDIIGYIGSTGFSTGPHLHYEMEKNGVKINPLNEVLPPGQPINAENQERFFSEIKTWQEELNK